MFIVIERPARPLNTTKTFAVSLTFFCHRLGRRQSKKAAAADKPAAAEEKPKSGLMGMVKGAMPTGATYDVKLTNA